MPNPIGVTSAVEKIPTALKESIRGVESIAKIVSAMQEFSHPGTDEMTSFELNHILDSTITVARNEWKFVANVETDFDESLPAFPGFASELNQAFLNIIVNASHAIADRVDEGKYQKGTISIRTEIEGEYALVTISDTGGGIPEGVREHIFEPFFTTKAIGKGTGQGLAIARSVIEGKHGGRLDFEVEDGVGTTFTLRLPLEANLAQSVSDLVAKSPSS